MSPAVDPSLERERSLASCGRILIGCDEVGRGALAGPVSVGVCAIDLQEVSDFPTGLRDSKLLSALKREKLFPQLHDWALASAVGVATAAEIDQFGIVACLGFAGKRALRLLHAEGVDVLNAVVLLDGVHDWLNPVLTTPLQVRTVAKADRDCASVSAASVIAKVHRDRFMVEQDSLFPGYGFASNKGYGSAAHLQAIAQLGATELHRHSWLKSIPAQSVGQ